MKHAILAICLAVAAQTALAESPATQLRRFEFEYGAVLKELPPQSNVQVWLPVPPSAGEQTVEMLRRNLPAEARRHTEPKSGNRMLHLAWKAGDAAAVSLSVVYAVQRREVRGQLVPNPMKAKKPVAKLTAEERQRFLLPDARVPNEGKPLTLLTGMELARDPLQLGRQLYNRVDDHLRYDKTGEGWGRGDAVWACDSRYGNCTDFHSLFMSLARSRGLPARFEIGFSVPLARGEGAIAGYHCWAWFFAEGYGWTPVDISEADKHPELKDYYYGNLSADRVAFSQGRDLRLAPPQQGDPLNFFIYPYVEVDGRPLAAEKIELKCRYRDI